MRTRKVGPAVAPPAAGSLHILVKWNPDPSFESDPLGTIAAHAQVLNRSPYVWWGKISKSGHRGLTADDVKHLHLQISSGKETHLYLYCPDKPRPTLHVGLVDAFQTTRPADAASLPHYYTKLVYPIPFWFRLRDIRALSLEHREQLLLPSGLRYDPVSSHHYPLIVHEADPLASVFTDIRTLGKPWHALQRLDLPNREDAFRLDPTFIFVIMPFSPSFHNVWKFGIEAPIRKMGYTCKRADSDLHNKDIMTVVHDDIQRARALIVDMSTNNPNVFYELGYAQGLNKDVLLITRNRRTVPFDLRSQLNLKYSSRKLDELARELGQYLKAILEGTPR